ncbi:hypothetical protein [Pedomonas mirosovicensis]|uniref:hypothetical protein n=1 Tax=Pedomonas mirosovicensis TaxID=2908641 RepID=UPI0021672A36|nr:hypothetical protein [Pedomonas mirosovicensis]MCH8686710.1 hypothetical protein [Pedomonas mirosovicensis]
MRIDLARPAGPTFLLAVAFCAAALAAALPAPEDALTGWLGAAVLFQSVPASAVFFLMLMRLIPGAWERDLRVPCEAATALLFPAAAAFVPVLFGIPFIYHWDGGASAFHALWLQPLFFAARTALYFAFLFWMVRLHVGRRPSAGAAAAGLILFTLLATMAATDWLMSLDPSFASSGFGLQVLSIEVVIGFAALLLVRLARGPAERPGVLGGLFLTLMLLWIYFQFMPYFIIWSGNLPDAVAWYQARKQASWPLTLWLVALIGGSTTAALLFSAFRANSRWLFTLAAATVGGKVLEMAWFALPGRGAIAVLAYLAAVLGLAILGVIQLLRRREAPT